jgi:hypothetical protein
MAFTFTCPQCQTKLRTAAAVPSGKTIQCPKCKTVFTAGAAEDEDTPAPRRPVAQAPTSPKRFANDDDDDRPRSRRRDDDGDDDEPRARRRSRAQDDYGGADDEREEDYGEPRKRKKKKKSGNKALFLTLMALLGLAVIGGGIFLLITLLGGGGGAVDKEMLAFAPADSKFIAGADVEDLLKQEKIKPHIDRLIQAAQAQPFRQDLQQIGLTENDFAKVMVAGAEPIAMDKGAGVFIVKLKEGKSIDRDKLKTVLKATEVQKDGKAYYKAKDFCLYMPTDKMAVLTPTEAGMAKVLGMDGKTVAISGPLKDMVDKAGGAQVWMALAQEGLGRQFGGGGMGAFGPMGGAKNMVDVTSGLKGVGVWGGASGEKLEINISLYCSSSDVASKAASSGSTELREARRNVDDIGKIGAFMGNDVGTLIKDVINSGDISSSGEQLVMSFKVSIDPIVNLINNKGAGIPGFGGMGAFGGPGPNLGAGNAPGAPKRGAKNVNPFGPGKAPPPKPPAGGPQVVPAPGPGGGIVLP